MKSRMDRPDRDAEDLGDPVERQVEVVVQDHHRAVIDGKTAEAAFDLVAIDAELRSSTALGSSWAAAGRSAPSVAALRVSA